MNVVHGIFASVWNNLQISFKLVWSVVSPYLLPLVTVIIVLVAGLWIAGFIGDKIGVVIKKGKIDDLLDKVILSHFSKLAGVKVSASGLIGETIHWFLTAIVLIAVLNLAHLSSVVDFLRQVIGYIPHAIIAALIVAVGSVVANFAAYAAKFITKSENWLTTVRLAINLFALVAALGHLITPLAASINHFLGQLSLSGTQGNALFIGVLVIILLASKNVITKAVEKLY
ncbi:MAG: hypothetical protein A3I68_07010 [Candidatus Melainabacteria bacterium RIFCSPLOWO2_02_FULL_35_15]|nr:MAG: hypothetical protein A3F80_04510 [Candidatus Melainabacteria bacterium RIFCSPLOWO2_12_FULL_35_11]OGI13542.1 MAG: hypothetical protein A3I68_07010 [Candidatus Melainabacteria bacterium RIFCSPLOWO2_02_FULL_35_15]